MGAGRVIVLTTTLDDSWNDLELKPVYLPLVHQLVRYISQYEQNSAWATVGQVVDLATLLKSKTDRVVITPGGERRTIGADEPSILELTEHGSYQVRAAATPSARADQIAVNIDPAESDLTPIDTGELVAAATGRASESTSTATAATEITPEDAEKRQNIWWYLLLAGLALLVAELVVANRLSQNERFT